MRIRTFEFRFQGGPIFREDKSSFCCAFLFFLGLYNEQGKVMFIVLVSQKSIRTSNDYRPEKSSESFKRKDRC